MASVEWLPAGDLRRIQNQTPDTESSPAKNNQFNQLQIGTNLFTRDAGPNQLLATRRKHGGRNSSDWMSEYFVGSNPGST